MTSNSFVLGRKYFLFNANNLYCCIIFYYLLLVSIEKPCFYEAIIGIASLAKNLSIRNYHYLDTFWIVKMFHPMIFLASFWSSLFYNTSSRHERHELRHKCDTISTWTTRVWHKWKILILIKTQVKTCFHTLIHKEKNNFILSTTFSF